MHRRHRGRIDVPKRPDASMADGTGAQVHVEVAAKKNGKEDLRKARFYLDRLIDSAGDD